MLGLGFRVKVRARVRDRLGLRSGIGLGLRSGLGLGLRSRLGLGG